MATKINHRQPSRDAVARAPARLKLPAYGKTLLNARRADHHPLCVHVIFGRDWKAETHCAWSHLPGVHPLLCVHPAEYTPGQYDFRAVTAINVALFDQDALAAEYAADGYPSLRDFGRLYDLAGELARWAAYVEIHSPIWPRADYAETLAYLGRDYRHCKDPDKNHGWPHWWSAEIQSAHERRGFAWLGTITAGPRQRCNAVSASL